MQAKSQKRRRTSWQRDKNVDLALNYAPKCAMDLCVAPKKVREIGEWLDQPDRPSLLILVGSPGIGKSTLAQVVIKERNQKVVSWNEPFCFWMQDVRGATTTVSPMESFCRFMESIRSPQTSLHLDDTSSRGMREADTVNSVVLLDSLPYAHTDDSKARLRQVLSTHAMASSTPTILILSDVVEGKASQSLPDLVDPHLISRGLVRTLHINPPTRDRFDKAIKRIARLANVASNNGDMSNLYDMSGGDIRSALLTLQLCRAESGSCKIDMKNDIKLSLFHALGKLLYAKRLETAPPNPFPISRWNETRNPLDFEPETVLESIDDETALNFVNYHSASFFNDISELSEAMDMLSCASMLVHGRLRPGRTGLSHTNASQSLIGRAVAFSNTNMAKRRFRQFSSPLCFQLWSHRAANQRVLRSWREDKRRAMVQMYEGDDVCSVDLFPFSRTVGYATPTLSGVLGSAVAQSLSPSEQVQDEHDQVCREDDIVSD